MRRFVIAVVVVGMVFGTGLSFAEEDTNHMPEKVRKFLDNFVGTWTFDGNNKGSATYKWDAGKACLIVSRQWMAGDEIRYATELIHWDGKSEDGFLLSMTVSGSKGMFCEYAHGKVLSPTLMIGKWTIDVDKKSGNFDAQIEFNGKNQFVGKFTNGIWDGEQQPDETNVFTRVKPTTREDFEEYCKLNQGRWVSETKLDADLPGVGKKGEKVTAYYESTIAQDGNGLIETSYGGKGSTTGLVVFNPGTKRIESTSISSSGHVVHVVVYKKGNEWIFESSGYLPDGRKTEGSSTGIYSNNGNTFTGSGSDTLDGDKTDYTNDIWYKVSK
jgi:hypothetical protein